MQWRRYCSEDLMPFATEEIGKQWLPIAIKHTPTDCEEYKSSGEYGCGRQKLPIEM